MSEKKDTSLVMLQGARANLVETGRPTIYSYAHGGKHYKLSHARETIELLAGTRHQYMDRIVEILREQDTYYRRASRLVAIDSDAKISIVEEHRALREFDSRFRFVRKIGNGQLVEANGPLETAKFLCRAYADQFPTLKAVVTAPIIEPLSGRLICGAGYDWKSGLYVSLPNEIPAISENPSAVEIEKALRCWRANNMTRLA